METFTDTKELVPYPHFNEKRNIVLRNINYDEIDTPVIELIKNISKLDYCFSLQSCYGHFLYPGENAQLNTRPLPILNDDISIDYRIAYLAICIKDNQDGKSFLINLTKLTLIDPEYIFKDKDRITIDYKEALIIEKVRNQFFISLNELIEKLIK
ncbi:MAG: hypothetical protein P8Z35_13890 [Ignavibacteriaceae bacterium]